MVKLLSYPKYALKAIRAKKFRFFLGVLAIAIAIGVFGVTNVLIEAISLSYLPQIAEETGQVDIRITNYNITSVPPIQNYEPLISQVAGVEGVVGATPRYKLQGAKFQGTNKSFTVPFLGIDPTREEEIEFGNLLLTPETSLGNLPENHCWVRQEIAQALELEVGEEYTLSVAFTELTITLDATFVNDGFLPQENQNYLITNIKTLEPFIGGSGIATEVVAQFTNREELYDVNRPDESVEQAKEIGRRVQNTIGTGYQVELPIAAALDDRGTGLAYLRILFNSLSLLGIFVSGFLIFSLMTVSVEEKTREFALYRTIGAKKRQIFILVLCEAGITCFFGAVTGIGFSYLISLLVNQFLKGEAVDVQVTLSPLIVLYSVLLGLGVAIIASLFPALRAIRKSIISGLNPLKAEEPDLKLVRERGPNKTFFLVGIAIAISTGLIFILIPIMTIAASDTLFFVVLLLLFFGFGFGVSLILVGVIEPLVENLLLRIIKPAFKKISLMIRMFLKRNRRRNAITSMMFILAFGTTMIISTTFLVQDQGTIKNIGGITGADIALYDSSLDINGTEIMENIVAEHEEIVSASYRTLPVSAALTGMWSVAGDQIFFNSFGINVVGVPSTITEPLYQDLIDITEGDETIFEEVQKNQTVIISEALAKELKLGKGDTLRLKLLTLNPVLINLGYTQDLFLEIVGVAGKIPGFTGIHEQERFAAGSTILIGEETWTFLTDLDFQASAFQIFFKATSPEAAISVGRDLRREYESDAMFVLITQEQINRITEASQTRVVLVNVMLVFTIVIALFGVFASTYSNVAESQKTIGILKAIGLKNRDVDQIFIIESGILTLSSCLLGGIMGYFLGYYLYSIEAIGQEWKIPIVSPPTISIISLLIAVVIASIGAFIATRTVSRKTASELIKME
ncbi:MAG: FtsX-like permease family protein [Candidatus Heimdallarchaeota archaeon]|nr:FtsX-like permease family protein [Candidatus Heimdallarchaeota archaeon]